MVTQLTEGLYRLVLLCQLVMVAGLFWLGVWIMVTFYSLSAELTWRRYSIYCGMLVLGMLLEAFTRSKNYFRQSELIRLHRLSLLQTIASDRLLVRYLVATNKRCISRVFLFDFGRWLYFALL